MTLGVDLVVIQSQTVLTSWNTKTSHQTRRIKRGEKKRTFSIIMFEQKIREQHYPNHENDQTPPFPGYCE